MLSKDVELKENFYLKLSSPLNLFENLFTVVLKLDTEFINDTKHIELIRQLTVCIIIAAKSGFYNRIDTFLLEKLKTSTDAKTLYLTMNCYQSIARICNPVTCQRYFYRFLNMYKNKVESHSTSQICVLKILIKTFFVCLPKKLKAEYFSKNDVMNRPVKYFALGLDLLESSKITEVEAEVNKIIEKVPECTKEYKMLVTILLLLSETGISNIRADLLLNFLKQLISYPKSNQFQSLIEVLVQYLCNTQEYLNQEVAGIICDILLERNIKNLSSSIINQIIYRLLLFKNPLIDVKLKKFDDSNLIKFFQQQRAKEIFEKSAVRCSAFKMFELEIKLLTTPEKTNPSSQGSSLFGNDNDEENDEPVAKRIKIDTDSSSLNELLDEILKLAESLPSDCKLDSHNKQKVAKIVNRFQSFLRK